MKVKVIDTFKFAKNCRESILFQKDTEVSLDGLGLTNEQIKYILINCKVNKVSDSTIEPVKEIKLEKAVVETEKVLEVKGETPEYLTIENKDDLIKYAEDKFSLKIDRRKSLETVREIIEDHLDTETN